MNKFIFTILRVVVLSAAVFCSSESFALKVVSLSPAVTELIFHLGKGDVLAGRSSACNHPAAAGNLPVLGDFARPAVTRILALKPDFVITNELIVPGSVKTFERAGIKLLHLPCRNLKDYCEMVQRVGKVVGAEKAAEEEVKKTEVWMASFKKKKRINKKILCLVWHKPVIAAGENTLLQELISLAGAENCRFNGVKGFFKPSARFLLNSRADMVLVFSPLAGYKRDPVLKNLPAVRAGKIFSIPEPDTLQRPGPRLMQGVEELRRMLEK